MKSIQELRLGIKSLVKKLGDLRARCLNENRDPSEEERSVADGILNEIERLEVELSQEERTQATLTRLESPGGTVADRTAIDTRTDPDEDEMRFASGGEFFQAVMRAGCPGGTVDRRLAHRAATGLSEGVPSDGGFLVQTDIASGILQNVWDEGAIPSRVRRLSLSGAANSIKINGFDETSRADGSRAGGIRAYWIAEAGEKTASKPAFREIELKVNKLVGLCYATDELLEDVGAMWQVIETGFRSELDFKLTDAIINGDGAGKPLGILNSGCMVSVAKETGQAADTIVYENITNMWSRMIASSRTNAIWIINQDCEPQLNRMSLAVGTGGVPVYMPAGGASASPYAMLFGRPVIPIEQCQTVGTTGDIMLCDFSHYVMADKGGPKQDVSMHVRFIYDESVFRIVYRVDGQPELAGAITPFKGTNTLSHFVKLASRD